MLLVISYALKERTDNPNLFSPTIINLDIFPVYDCILARDRRMYNSHGGWFGYFETPTILSNQGKQKMVLLILKLIIHLMVGKKMKEKI